MFDVNGLDVMVMMLNSVIDCDYYECKVLLKHYDTCHSQLLTEVKNRCLRWIENYLYDGSKEVFTKEMLTEIISVYKR